MGFGACQFSRDPSRQVFAEFYSPLVEGVYPPDGGFDKGLVLIHGQQHAQGVWVQPVVQDGGAGPVAVEVSMGFGSIGLALHQGFALGQAVGDQQLVLFIVMTVVQGQQKVDGRPAGALVQELENSMLRLTADAAPDDLGGIYFQPVSFRGDGLAVTLHHQLAQIGR